MEGYNYHPAITGLQQFFHHEFCDYYLEYVKWRVYDSPDSDEARGALAALEEVLQKSLLMLAPISPHITEELYSEAFGKSPSDSIHLQKWPEFDGNKIDATLEQSGADANLITSMIWKERTARALGAKETLAQATVTAPGPIGDFSREIASAAKVGKVLISKGAISVSVI